MKTKLKNLYEEAVNATIKEKDANTYLLKIKNEIISRAQMGKNRASFYNLPNSLQDELTNAGFTCKTDAYDKDWVKIYWQTFNTKEK